MRLGGDLMTASALHLRRLNRVTGECARCKYLVYQNRAQSTRDDVAFGGHVKAVT